MERGLLSDPALAARYGDVVWMYLYQDFSRDAADRAAERVAIRFGITAWPQHFLVDPHTLDVLADTGRSLATFGAAVERARVVERDGITTERLRDADARAAALEADVDAATAEKALTDEDVVVRFRAIQRLRAIAPDTIVANADTLLRVPHDQTRFLVCEVLATAGDARAKPQLEALVRDPAGSRNPNVLRIRAVTALARCGDADSVAVIAPCATSGAYFNGLTGTALDALVAIAARIPDAGPAIADVLRNGFPAPTAGADDRERRACRALAERVHGALVKVRGVEQPFPAIYDTDARTRLIAQWRAVGK